MNAILKPGREKSLLRRHPWIFSGAIQQADSHIASGATVDLLSSDQQFVARASYSPHSQIRARVWTFDPNEQVDADFFQRKIRSAIDLRASFSPSSLVLLSPGGGNAHRLIYAESD